MSSIGSSQNENGRLFAVIPAAGHSRRMGKPKLLLPLGGRTVIARLLEVLDRPEIAETVVVVRPDDAPLREEILSTSRATVFQPPEPPSDMRASVEYALAEIGRKFSPADDEGWLLVPADHPVLDPTVMDRLISYWKKGRMDILVPRFGNRRGHPTLFRWKILHRISSIPPDQGLNWLLEAHASEVTELSVESPSVVTDLDTPEDYRMLQQEWEPPPSKG